jgi:autotransporter translocation and assembly factor TamB
LSGADGTLLQSLQVHAHGTTAKHRLTLNADTGNEQLQATLRGGLDTALSAWQGELAELAAITSAYGNWVLSQPAALTLASKQVSLAESCIVQRNGNARTCTGGTWSNADGGNLQAQIEHLPLSFLLSGVDGSASAELTANLSSGGALRAEGDIHISPGEVSVELEQNRHNLAFSGGDITFDIDASGLHANVDLGLPENGRVNGTLTLPELTALPMSADQPLAGRIQAHLPRLDAVTTWVPEIARSSGRLDADFTLAGTTTEPQLTGAMSLHGGRADIPLAGLELREIDLQITSDGALADDISIVGRMVSGRGEVQLSGSANPMRQSASLQLQGENVQVYATPDARVWLSPELTLGWQDETLSLRGQLTIPEAAITPKLELSPGALGNDKDEQATPGQVIAPSADVVVINRNAEPPETLLNEPAPFRIDSRVKLVLGDDVRINAVGFVSHITGAVLFTNTPVQAGLIPIANGRLALQGGTFRAFGQDLEIENGQIIFANVPATEPELDLRAVRWIDNDPQVTAAGVTVTGPAREPVLELFSRPQLETSEIQSYLLTGRSPRSKDNVLGLGTYISPRIYVGYGYNMVEKTSEFNSLFTISPRYGLGANVGEADNNINVTFTYER